MELFNGRPENTEGRLPREVRTYDFLDNVGIEYKRTDHEPANNMEACNEIDAVLGVLICKNLFLCNRQKTNFYLLFQFAEAHSESGISYGKCYIKCYSRHYNHCFGRNIYPHYVRCV